MTNWSAPAITFTTGRRSARLADQQEDKQVDYSHLDIVAEVERITGCSFKHVSKDEYSARCPFPGCTSQNDGFRVWDRAVLDWTRDNKREKHFWCRRCDRSGDLISLIRQYREAISGEVVSWKEAARELRIDPRTWRASDESDEQRGQSEGKAKATARDQRRQQAEQRRKAGEKELSELDAAYPLARAALASGQIVQGELTIPLDLAREYLAARGFTLEQAAALGMGYIPMRQEIGRNPGELLSAWRGRVLFPLTGPKGVRGYAGRSLWKWAPGMSAEQHRRVLEVDEKNRIPRHYKTYEAAYYGYEDACLVSTVVIVEGEFDAASVRLALVDETDIAVCAFATNFHARLIPLNVLNVILALDVDQAGKTAIERQKEELEARGIIVTIVRPPAGKDWNDCHCLAGLDAIRAAIADEEEKRGGKQRKAEVASAEQGISNPLPDPAILSDQQRTEPSGYENGDVCLFCGKQVEQIEGAFYICEDKASEFYGDMFCTPCWLLQSEISGVETESELGQSDQAEDARSSLCLAHVQKVFDAEPRPEPYTLTLLPAGMSSDDYIGRYTCGERPGQVIHPAKMEMVTSYYSEQGGQARAENYRCGKHGKPLSYSDELGGRYCDHVDCWERYRLIRAGAQCGYSALFAVIDSRDYLADISAVPLYHTDSGLPVYPLRPVIRQQIIAAGVDAWKEYASGRGYQEIDQAVKALASAQ